MPIISNSSKVDKSAGKISFPVWNGHKITAAIEDTRSAIINYDLSSTIVESTDKLDAELSEALDCDDINTAQENLNSDNCFALNNDDDNSDFKYFNEDVNPYQLK